MILFTGHDEMVKLGEESLLRVKVEKKIISYWAPNITDIEVFFYINEELIGQAITDSAGIASLAYRPEKPGVYHISYHIELDKVKEVESRRGVLFVIDDNRPAVVVDIDGTISDYPDWRVPFSGDEAPIFPHADKFLTTLSQDYHIVYLTARDDILDNITMAFLQKHQFPQGPVLYNDWRQFRKNPEQFKYQMIKRLQKNGVTIVAGIGNSETDVKAYVNADIDVYIRNEPEIEVEADVVFFETYQELEKVFHEKRQRYLGTCIAKTVYLDSNATTQIAPSVIDAMLSALRYCHGNPAAVHKPGIDAGERIKRARMEVAQLLDCLPDEVIFTSGGSESNNQAIFGLTKLLPEDKRHIITTEVEHPSVCKCLEKLAEDGYDITRLPVNEHGHLDMETLEQSLSDDTGLVTIMWANNETGVIFPIEKIAQLVKEKTEAYVHVDAVQAIGKIPVKTGKNIDSLAISGHKFHAAKGIGALFVRNGINIPSLILGAGQENGRRAGTSPVPGICALGVASRLAREKMDLNENVKKMRDKLQNFILENIPDTRLNGCMKHRLPNTANISFAGVLAQEILEELDKVSVYVSAGAACNAGVVGASQTLQAMKVPGPFILGAIRFSLSHYTRDTHIDYVIETIPKIIEDLRNRNAT